MANDVVRQHYARPISIGDDGPSLWRMMANDVARQHHARPCLYGDGGAQRSEERRKREIRCLRLARGGAVPGDCQFPGPCRPNSRAPLLFLHLDPDQGLCDRRCRGLCRRSSPARPPSPIPALLQGALPSSSPCPHQMGQIRPGPPCSPDSTAEAQPESTRNFRPPSRSSKALRNE